MKIEYIKVAANPSAPVRVVAYHEGGCHVERHVGGVGFVLDNDALTDQQAAQLLCAASAACLEAARRLSVGHDWTAQEILDHAG